MAKTNQRVRVAIDAMGGDYAPGEIVKGAVAAAQKSDVEIILVGPTDIVEAELTKYNISRLPIHCVKAEDLIKKEKLPALAVSRKSNSSIAVATKLVKEGEADGLLGATATGPLVTSAFQFLGMIDGIERPVIGGVLSGIAPKTAIFDLGVNVDCKPEHLLTFAIIGSVYAKIFLDIAKPTVALLNIGQEKDKGNRLTREAYPLLQKSGLNFIGNIEGSGIFSGQANVIVCDGFVGNTILKFSENGAATIANYLKSKAKGYPIISHLLKGKVKDLMVSLYPPDSIGDGLIWGIDGIVLKIHGHSRASVVTNKIAQVKMAVEKNVLNYLKTELSQIKERIKK